MREKYSHNSKESLLWKSVAASLAATALVTVGYNVAKGVTLHDAKNVAVATATGNVEATGHGSYPHLELSSNHTDWAVTSEKTETPARIVEEIGMEWAEAYSRDPNADELTNHGANVLQDLNRRIQDMYAQGYRIVGDVQIQGFASQEGETGNPADPAGLRTENPENPVLADTRAEALKVEIMNGGLNLHGTNVEVIPGEEIQHTQEAEEIADYIEQKAADMGVDALELVKQYNRDPSSLPDDVVKEMDRLKDNRFNLVTINFVKESNEIHEIPTNHRSSIFIVPVIIPLFRRKQGEYKYTPRPNPAPAPTPKPEPQPNPFPNGPDSERPEPSAKERTKPEHLNRGHNRKQPLPHSYNTRERGLRNVSQRRAHRNRKGR